MERNKVIDFNEGDRAIIKEIAFEVAGTIKEELCKDFKVQLELHMANCPAKQAVARWPKQMVILMIGVAIGSGGGLAAVLKLLKVF